MKKILFTTYILFSYLFTTAQATKDWKKEVIDRPGDHLMISFTSDHWSGAPDSIRSRVNGFPRGLGFAIMLDKPFKTDPHWSIALGLGINGSNIFFDNMSIDIKANSLVLPFNKVDSVDHFKKYKLVNVYAELPLELRYAFTPEKRASWKVALGMKTGLLIDAHTKGKTLVNSREVAINYYILKEKEKTFFNGLRFMATARIGYGSFSAIGTYSLTGLLKDGAGANIKPWQIGLCISGL